MEQEAQKKQEEQDEQKNLKENMRMRIKKRSVCLWKWTEELEKIIKLTGLSEDRKEDDNVHTHYKEYFHGVLLLHQANTWSSAKYYHDD